MANNSKIEWTHHTANLWHGCTRVHEGCDHCYAATLSHRWGRDLWGNDKPRMEIKSVWNDLAKQQKLAAAAGEMHRVFVGSMMDIFEKPMLLVNSKGIKLEYSTYDLRSNLFDNIGPYNKYPNLMFLFLTKRETNIPKYIPDVWKDYPPVNVMFGASVVNQVTFDRVVENLKQVKGKKFLSIEPQLDEIRLTDAVIGNIDWIINGGESGYGKRPFNCDWARSLKRDCERYGIPFFFKQVDKVQAIPDDLMIRQFPKAQECDAIK